MTKMDKANRILFDVICIVVIIIFPLWLLRILGFERIVTKNDSTNRKTN